ncbi:MAG: glycosyltransferase family 4 protein [Actinomycetota bacterium]|nr:glycosyltransferase family 4 protein [Actinomycetota bacterium]
MRLAFVVQRYGAEIGGGSEAACRMFAERMAARGHRVDVLTSCAKRYTDWADEYPPGAAELNGVTVRRFGVARLRTDQNFGVLNQVVHHSPRPLPMSLQQRWLREQGPDLPSMAPWLRRNRHRYDVVVVVTYLYPTAVAGLQAAAGHVPTVFMPTAHLEPYLGLTLFDTAFALTDGFAFLTPEEASLVEGRFGLRDRPSSVVGIGLDPLETPDPTPFRLEHGLGDDPYLLCLGRLDPAKGAHIAATMFDQYKQRHPGPLKLVFVGDRVTSVPDRDDVVMTGYVSEEDKHRALAGSIALLHPSFFESFSIVLTEAWAHGVPVIVNAACDVLAGQTTRARGGLGYRTYAEFEAAVEELMARPDLRSFLGESGRRYVADTYQWDAVLDRFESVIAGAEATFRSRAELAAQA